MRAFWSLLLPFVVSAVVQAANTPEVARRAFVQSGLDPEVWPNFKPIVPIDVTFTISDDGETKAVDPPGRNFTRPQTAIPPTYSVPFPFDTFLGTGPFVVAMVDPDAPTPQNPTSAQIRHFLGGNFRLQHKAGVGAVLLNNTPALSEYRQPTPPNTSDPHRYTWLLFRQPLDFPTNVSADVTLFNISAFAQQFHLGPALAGNFMTVSTNPADGVPPE